MQVSIRRCDSFEYDLERVKTAVWEVLKPLGGIGSFVKPGERVLLKVNLLMKKDPSTATTTHPIFVQAMVELLQAHGASVIIGDSPGGLFNERALRSVYQGCGITEMAERCGAALNWNVGSSEVSNPDAKYLKTLINVDMLRDVDRVINLAKLKTHGMMKMTGAVKNLFGTVPGTMKAEYHLNWPELDRFADALIDVCLAASPDLSLIDGIVAMEGDGPSSGDPREVGVILASQSPYQLDRVAAAIIGAEPEEIPTLRQSIKRGLASEHLKDVALMGDSLNSLIQRDFRKPELNEVNWINGKLPAVLVRAINRTLRSKPVFDHQICVGCKDCYHNCPPKAIAMVEKRPVVDLEQCIRCYCCQELCPHKAVTIRRPRLLQRWSK